VRGVQFRYEKLEYGERGEYGIEVLNRDTESRF